MKKGVAVNTLVIFVILLITMFVIIYIILEANNQGSTAISNFFGFLKT